jgi:hypothetical protein
LNIDQMPKVKKRKKKKSWFGKKEIIVTVSAIILTTIGIKASDEIFGPDSSVPEGPCPPEMVFVASAEGGFCIDRYEASASGDCPNTIPSGQTETRDNLSYPVCKPESKPGALPWRYISQDQAALACAKAGKRLPSNQEWLQAALGTPDKDNGWGADDCQVSGNWSQQPGPSGSGKNCVSAAGAFDMVGNLWEWVQGAANDGKIGGKQLPNSGYVDSMDGEGLPGITNPDTPNPDYNSDYFWLVNKGLRGIVRGGYWDNKSDAGQYSVYMVAPPSSGEAGIGFRCAL